MSLVRVVDKPLDRLDGELAAAFFFEDERPVGGPAALLDWRLNGRLTELILAGSAAGRAGEQVLIQGNGKIAAPWVLFIGGGSWNGLCEETYRNLVRHLARSCVVGGFSRITLGLAAPEGMAFERIPPLVESAVGDVAPAIEWRLACSPLSTRSRGNRL